MSDANQAIIEEKRLRQPQPTPAVVPDSTEDWESGISFSLIHRLISFQ